MWLVWRNGEPMVERHQRLREALRRVLATAGMASYFSPPRWDGAAWVGGRAAELLPLPLGLKQALLEMDDTIARLDVVGEFFTAFGQVRGA